MLRGEKSDEHCLEQHFAARSLATAERDPRLFMRSEESWCLPENEEGIGNGTWTRSVKVLWSEEEAKALVGEVEQVSAKEEEE